MGAQDTTAAGPTGYAPGPFSFLGRMHFRLLLVVLASVLPLLALVLHSHARRRDDSIRAAGLEVDRFARIAARNQERAFETARALLGALAEDPAIAGGSPGDRSASLRAALERYPGFVDFRVAGADGTIVASALPEGERPPSDPDLLRKAAATGRPAVGNFLRSGTRVATVEMALPGAAREGSEPFVVAAFLHLGWLEEFPRTLQVSSDATLQILSPAGEVLARVPAGGGDLEGSKHPVPDLRRTVALGDGSALVAEDLDGVRRFFGISALDTGGTNRGYFVVVGVPEEEVLRPVEEALRTSLAWTLVAVILSLGAARLVGERFILRRLTGLILATKRLASTDLRNLKARRRVCQDPSEIGDLERSFDLMALHLEERAAELEARSAELEAKARTLDPPPG